LNPTAELASVSGDYDVGTLKMNDFDWTKLGIRSLACFLKHEAVKTAALLYISFVVQVTHLQYSIPDCILSSN
jgi:hypothetical protein